jgi:hypothetical protein
VTIPPELTLPELVFAADRRNQRTAMARQLSARLSLVLAGPMLVTLAAQLQRLQRRNKWLSAIGFICVSSFVIEAATRSAGVDKGLTIWFLPALALAMTILLGLGARMRGEKLSV